MTQEQIAELIVTLRNNPAFRKLVVGILRDDLLPEMKVRAAGKSEPMVPVGLLSYKEVQQILGCPAGYVRKLVYNAVLEGRDGYVDEAGLVRWATTYAKRTYREKVVDWARDRKRQKEDPPVVVKELQAKPRKRTALVAEGSTQLRMVV